MGSHNLFWRTLFEDLGINFQYSNHQTSFFINFNVCFRFTTHYVRKDQFHLFACVGLRWRSQCFPSKVASKFLDGPFRCPYPLEVWVGVTHVIWNLRNYLQDDRICSMTDLPPMSNETKLILATVPNGPEMIQGYELYMEGHYIGSTTAMIAEAADASATGAPVEDGMSG
jgi:hypothetical protein